MSFDQVGLQKVLGVQNKWGHPLGRNTADFSSGSLSFDPSSNFL
jgi:hypothetical protein